MKKWGVVLLGWFFIALGPGNGGNQASNFFTVVPSFQTKADCEAAAGWVRSMNTGTPSSYVTKGQASDCYPDDKQPIFLK